MNIKPYCQRDSSWGSLKIGKSNLTMKSSGCYITSISMILRKIPSIVLDVLNKNDCFTPEGGLISAKAAQVLDMVYSKVLTDPKKVCIMETDSNKVYGVPQHFVVWLGNGFICDPLTGSIVQNKYHPVSFRTWDKRSA